MSKSDSLEVDLLQFLYQDVPWPDNYLGGQLFVSLHSADPGEDGQQITNELTYEGYTRVTTSRSVSDWVISGSTISNTAAITFGICTGTISQTATHAGIGLSFSGTGYLLHSGELASPVLIANSFTPRFASGSVTVTEG